MPSQANNHPGCNLTSLPTNSSSLKLYHHITQWILSLFTFLNLTLLPKGGHGASHNLYTLLINTDLEGWTGHNNPPEGRNGALLNLPRKGLRLP